MANVMEIVVKAQDLASGVLTGVGEAGSGAASMIADSWAEISIVGGAAGMGIEALNRSQKDNTDTTRRLAASLGLTEDQIRALAVESANVTRPLDQVLDTMEIGRQQGIRNVDQLMDFVAAWDTIGDATGENAAVLAENGQAMRAFGLDVTDVEKSYAALGFLQEETTIGINDFLNMVGMAGPELSGMGLSVEQAAALFGVLKRDMGLSDRAIRREFIAGVTAADGTLEGLLDTMGITEEQFTSMTEEVEGNNHIIERNADIYNESFTPMQRMAHWLTEVRYKYAGLALGISMVAVPLIALGPAIKLISMSLGYLRTAITGVSKAFTFLAANPAVAIAIAIAALVAGLVILYNKNETFRDFVKTVWEKIQGVIEAVWGVIKPIWDLIVDGIQLLIDAYKLLWEAIKMYVEFWWGIIQKAWDIIRPIWDKLWELGQSIITMFANLWEKAQEIWQFLWGIIQEAWDIIRPIWEKIESGIKAIRDLMGDLKEAWGKAWEAIKEAAKGVIDWIAEKVDWVVGKIQSAIDLLGKLNPLNWTTGLPPGMSLGDLSDLASSGRSMVQTPGGTWMNVPGAARGGIAMATPGGFLVNIAEGGRNERITPLGGPDDPMTVLPGLLEELIAATREARVFRVNGRDLVDTIGQPLVEEIRGRTGV